MKKMVITICTIVFLLVGCNKTITNDDIYQKGEHESKDGIMIAYSPVAEYKAYESIYPGLPITITVVETTEADKSIFVNVTCNKGRLFTLGEDGAELELSEYKRLKDKKIEIYWHPDQEEALELVTIDIKLHIADLSIVAEETSYNITSTDGKYKLEE